MLDVILTLTPISLIDSLSLLPFAVVVLAVLLSGPKPYVAATSFLLGIFLSYFAAGVVIAWGLGEVIERVTEALVHWFKNPSALDYILSIVIGVAAIVSVTISAATTRRAYQQMFETVSGRAALEVVAAGGESFDQDVVRLLEETPGVAAAAPLIKRYTIMYLADRKVKLLALGIDPERDRLVRDYEVTAGRFLDDGTGRD